MSVIQKMLTKAMVDMSVSAYDQAKTDLEKNDYDPKRFKAEIKELIRKEIKKKLPI